MFRLAPFVVIIFSAPMISSSPSDSNKISGSQFWSPSSFRVLSDQHRTKQPTTRPILIMNQFRGAKEMKTTRRRNKVASELLMVSPPPPVVKFDDDDAADNLLGPNEAGKGPTIGDNLLASGSSASGLKSAKSKQPHRLEIEIGQRLAEKYQPQVLATLVDSQFGDEKWAGNSLEQGATSLDHPLSSLQSTSKQPDSNPNNGNLSAYDDRRPDDQQVTRQESAAHRKEGLFSLDEHKQQEHERWLRNRAKEDEDHLAFSTPATTRDLAHFVNSANLSKLASSAGSANSMTAAATKPAKRRKPQQQRHNSQQVVVSGGNKGAGGVEKPPAAGGQVLLAKDVSVRSDLLFIRTSNGSSSAGAGIDGLPSRNLSGSIELPPPPPPPPPPPQVGRQVWTRRQGSAPTPRQRPSVQLLELAEATPPHRRLIIDLEPVEEEEQEQSLAGSPLASVAVALEEPAEGPLPREDGLSHDHHLQEELIKEQTHAQLTAGEQQASNGLPSDNGATSSTADIEVSDEVGPGAPLRGLLVNHRGLIVAAKRGGSLNRPPYNFSALYANHVDHSLSPINKTDLQHHSSELGEPIKRASLQQQQLSPPTHLPAFLHQRPPTVSSVIWRNHTSNHHSNRVSPNSSQIHHSTYHLIGGSVDGGPPYLVPSSKFNPMSIFTDLAVSEQDRDQRQASTSSTTTSTTRRPVLATETPSYQLDGRGGHNRTSTNQTFHHNPPYKHQQSHHQPQLDLAATQQIVQAFDNKTLILASMTRRKQQASGNNSNKHHDPNRPANANSSRPSTGDHHQAAAAAATTTYDTTTPPFELNQTISSSLNAPLAASSSPTTGHQNLSSSTTSSSRPQTSTNGKLMSKLQHMIIGKILKQHSSSGNMSSAGNSFVPTSLAQWPATTTSSSPIQQTAGSMATTATNVTPPPLLSTTVANNVASLIAQKLSTLFTKSAPPPTTTSSHQASGLGLSSLFGYRVGGHNGGKPVRQRLSPLIQTAHSPLVNRRTAGMGSILVSGLIYGLSVLPALMALTGVNPLTGSGASSGGQQDQIATSGSSYSFSVKPLRAASRRTTTTPKPTTTSDTSNKLQEAYAYLVPVMSAMANSLDDDDDFLSSADTETAHQTSLKQLYAPSPTVIDANDAIPVHLLDTSLQADSLVGLANHPLSFVPTLPTVTQHQPYHQRNRQHHYPYAASVYKNHLHYSSPLVGPSSTNNHWQHTYSAHQNSWHNPVTTTTSTSTSTTPTPETFEHTTFRSVQHHKTKRRDLYSTGSSPHGQTSFMDGRTASPGLANRAYHVGYTLNYKPIMMPSPVANRQQQFIEFQSVNDMDQLADQWRPIQVPVASSRSSEGEAKYNLNQGISRPMRQDARDSNLNPHPRTLVRVDEPSQGYNLNQSLQRLRSDVGGVFTRYVKQPTNDDER